ncbi:ImmA/IrrE family metallo-endopeptidase [Rhodococcus erythropolis]|uniref:ImmA/IrrE family metallo-endopeptidase n=1 Tax=Rhodococcus erythropolis TaxID=1833 RepID=UPI0029493396|nr:ImmA/IrrE family metallo-endopeptidase [Rhodococcus erythropolis]MDV6276359.1 ImmA/IrrE family metallo-endopeptidase [Rhodococcus erythropolis]
MARNAVLDAQEVLEAYWADTNGDVVFPVDPVKIATLMDADVFVDALPLGVSGCITKRADMRAEIILSEDNGPQRQRFTCAHEIGHLYSRRADRQFEYKDYRDGRAADGVDSEEIYANRFAAALLMPAKFVRQFHEMGLPVSHLARRFGVSVPAIEYRLKNLGLA